MTVELSDEKFYLLVDYRMSEPVPIEKADLTQPFIYDRDYGVFYVDSGYHQLGMAMLFAWRHGYDSVRKLLINNNELKEEVNKKCYSSSGKYEFLADLYLSTMKGTAMGSSVSDYIQIGKLNHLNENEKIIFSRYNLKIWD